MKMRLIDAIKVEQDIISIPVVSRTMRAGIRKALRCIEEAPRIDTVADARCFECMYSRPVDRSKPPEKYYREDCVVCTCEDVVGDEPMIYPPNHFCSFAIRKEDVE